LSRIIMGVLGKEKKKAQGVQLHTGNEKKKWSKNNGHDGHTFMRATTVRAVYAGGREKVGDRPIKPNRRV